MVMALLRKAGSVPSASLTAGSPVAGAPSPVEMTKEVCRKPALRPRWPVNPGRETKFQASGARASESLIVQKNNVATGFADQPAVGQDGHRTELTIDNTVETTIPLCLFGSAHLGFWMFAVRPPFGDQPSRLKESILQ